MSKKDPAAPPLDRHILVIAGVVILGAVMTVLDTTIVSVALRTLGNEFTVSLDTIQWVSTAYMLALATVIPLTGWGADRFGTKPFWLTSLVLFTVGSVLCGLAWSASSLIVFRVLQGLGGGMIVPVGMSLLTQVAGRERIGRVMSIVSVPLMLGPVLGPMLGGLLVDTLSWRSIFYINLPIGIVALILSMRLLPSDRGQAKEKLDVLGLVLLSPGLALFVYGLSSLSSSGFGSPEVLIGVLGGLVLLVLFVFHALRAERPLLDLKLLRLPVFSASVLINVLGGAAMIGSMLLLPLYYQVVRGETALLAGLLTVPQGIGAALVQPISGRMVDRGRAGTIVLIGLPLLALGYLAFTQLDPHTSYLLLSASLLVMGMGAGCTMGPVMSVGFAAIDRRSVPKASATLNIVLRIGGSIGTALFAVVLQNEVAAQLSGVQGGGLSVMASIPPNLRDTVGPALSTAFSHTFWWPLAIAALGILPALLLPRSRKPQTPQPKQPTDKAPTEATPA